MTSSLMSDFKTLIEQDREVFLNLEEFGEKHLVEGKEISAVLDDEILADAKRAEDIGLSGAEQVLYAKVEDLPPQRQSGQSLNVDGRECIIVAWRTDYGMARIYMTQNEQG